MKRKEKRNGNLIELKSHCDVVYSVISDGPEKNGLLMALTAGNENHVKVIQLVQDGLPHREHLKLQHCM